MSGCLVSYLWVLWVFALHVMARAQHPMPEVETEEIVDYSHLTEVSEAEGFP